MATNVFDTGATRQEPAAIGERRNRSVYAQIIHSAAFASLLLVSVATSNQAQTPQRQSGAAAFHMASARTTPAAAARLRYSSYAMESFNGSSAHRRWPLMDGQTASHRFQFTLRDRGIASWTVQCHRMAITGDRARNGTRLDCSLTAAGQEGSWRLQVSGRTRLDGALRGADQQYEVRHASAAEMKKVGGSGRVSGYYIFSGDALVAAVELRGRGFVWINEGLSDDRRRAVAASIFALLVDTDVRDA